jgi:uncharacterized membrane protein YheB (UPF0754 family)
MAISVVLLLLLLAGFGSEHNVHAFSSTTPMMTPLSQPRSRSSSSLAFSHEFVFSLGSPSLQAASTRRTFRSSGISRNSPRKRSTSLSVPNSRSLVTKLTTASDPLEEGESEKAGIFRNAANKFKARPGTYLMIPVIAGFVGWLTNYLAVQMIFYPIKFKGIALWRRPEVPLALLGWQGIVPCKTKTMSKALVEMVTSQLLTIPEAFERLNPTIVAKHLAGAVPRLGEEVILDVAGGVAVAGSATAFPLGLWKGITSRSWYSGILNFGYVQVLKGVVKDLIKNSERIFSLENCVVEQMILDRAKLGQLFQKVGQVELDFLTNSGLWFGFLLGLIQMAVALLWENPWALSIGGMIVGLATNWLALKWIFEPVYPTKIGPFTVQGMFLTRQKEVAAEFSKFFADKIVTSEQIWNTILTDEATKPALTEVLGKHVKRLLNIATFGGLFGRLGGLSLPSPALIGKVTGSAVANLPGHLTKNLHGYVDGALQLETTLRVQMEAMSPAKFERVLHPIFEEDELTLIIAGGVLGFIAGLIQQGLETGAIQIPPLPAPIQSLLSKINSKVIKPPVAKARAVLGNIKGRFGGKNNNDGGSSLDPENGDGVSGE